jgi:hypothetical protein
MRCEAIGYQKTDRRWARTEFEAGKQCGREATRLVTRNGKTYHVCWTHEQAAKNSERARELEYVRL